MNTALTRRRSDAGFSLMEILAVLIIIGLLAGIAIPLYMDQTKKGHDAATKSDVNDIGTALVAYLANNTVFPDLTVSGQDVKVDGEPFQELRPGVVLGPLVGTNKDNWCVDATQPQGDRAKTKGYKFTASAAKVEEGRCV